ncbi:MAG: terminase large subunit domain-containing protein [Fimbriimonadaceae bacterium]
MVETELPEIEISPQPGPQEQFLSTKADIAVYGGSAGAGKTYALLLGFLRHVRQPGFGAVVFRRTAEQIRMEGGLWDEAQRLYPTLRATGREQQLDWTFPSGATITFDSLQHEKDKLNFQGAQICGLGLDELTHFTATQFFYLLSRNRSTCGVRPYVRATTNPDATSWVKQFLAPWLDRNFARPAESGELRWFTRDAGQIAWVPASTADAKSVTFIRALIYKTHGMRYD